MSGTVNLTENYSTEDKTTYSKITNDKKVETSNIPDLTVMKRCRQNNEFFDSLCNGYITELGYTQEGAVREFITLLASQTRDPNQIERIFDGSGLNNGFDDIIKNKIIDEVLENTEPTRAKKDDPYNKYFSKKGKFVVKYLAEEILRENHFFTLKDTKEVYYYQNGVYLPNGIDEISKQVQDKLDEHYRKSYKKEVIDYIKTKALVDRESINNNKYIINLKNGLYDVSKGKFLPHSPKYMSTIQLPVYYKPEAECPNIEKFLSDVTKSDKDKQLIFEWIGYTLIPNTRLQKFVMFYGPRDGGKSVLIKLITCLLGNYNVSGESLQNLENDDFSIANLEGKLLNAFPDLPDYGFYQNSVIKIMTGDDGYIRVNIKKVQPYKTTITARLMFSTNNLPVIKNPDEAFFKRLMLIEFPNTFQGDSKDVNLIDKLTTSEELSGLLNKAIAALERLLKNGEFSYDLNPLENMELYQKLSNPVAKFADECVGESNEYTFKVDMYNAYVEWCEKEDIVPLKKNEFGKQFKNLGYRDSRLNTGDRSYCWDGVSLI
ncbi:phage/plasmid primase, P4 family [Methanohalobium evestigatum Z-7303]|uniref:Phage/plasmid primase, P4 family n=1 Tax=Methanohalobium evestigatum (strain ATCC BAA-1072 / DSM 3721 / NBRC 107634 / OCM 161 / Z-7303) TaxID=644295 RepID=D7E825_METEZ|nr:phage/plasmid primase, P4 family [Methanohalobium evestigatum]ADI73367.1 phage/plasmid primase, P4 family [Methanohalobium evestigatum Z-7303]